MDSKLRKLVHTKTELVKVVKELELVKNSIYKNDEGGWDETLDKSVRSWVAEIIRTEINAGNIDRETYVRELLEALTTSKIVVLTVGVDPSDKVIRMLSEWMEKNMGMGWIADIRVDEKLLGGAKVAVEGRYIDRSLLSIWMQTWSEHEKDLLKE